MGSGDVMQMMRETAAEVRTRNITLIRGKDVADYPVRNPLGEDLGTIKDVMIDLDEGCIAYAALSFGGFLGFGDKLFAVPWEALRYNATDDAFVLDLPRERLENAPGFDKENWPTSAERGWLSGMYGHYGYTPPWERRMER